MVFQAIGVPLVQYVLDGKNVCLFAYGQTGSGKTFSMAGNKANPGLVPRMATMLFDEMARKEREMREDPANVDKRLAFAVDVSVVEVYCERVNDLLDTSEKRFGIPVEFRKQKKVGYYLPKCKSVPCLTAEEVNETMDKAMGARSVRGHKLNPESSRAHTIYMVSYKQTLLEKGEPKNVSQARMNLVDLAGVRRRRKLGA
jgi:hypothetical protein